MMFFKKIIEVHGYIGVKSNSKTFLQNMFFEILSRFFKFQKNANMT